jgi:hypothetical protein
MTPIEKVAYALYVKSGLTFSDISYWNGQARAAIEALRDPSEKMIEASNREWDGRMSHRSSGAWQAMIDCALAEGDGK